MYMFHRWLSLSVVRGKKMTAENAVFFQREHLQPDISVKNTQCRKQNIVVRLNLCLCVSYEGLEWAVISSESTLIWSYMYQCIIICTSKYFSRQLIQRKTRRRKKWFWQTYSIFTLIAMYTEEDKYKKEDKVPACQLWEAKVEQRSPFWKALQCKCTQLPPILFLHPCVSTWILYH